MGKEGRASDKRGYRKKGLEFSNIEFASKAERLYVRNGMRELAKRIAEARGAKGISQEKLAELANVSVSTIKFIEQNQRAPSLPVLFKLLYILDRGAKVWSR